MFIAFSRVARFAGAKVRTLRKGVVIKHFNVTCHVSLHSVHDQATAAANDTP
ncbi:hypothetical protein Plim_3571 [Planctopirus limnophila DSM 3776]|uniref:Uncharacterized protein n=1 Tax=Planctopirus limnophila (strain ATCC 43296 / DSM 3776 / IFAM 1008 / Mu 290) TaxID=521674 RepID=D5SVM4_PLAL2|nr:hypothetical protein Plim_3571 [Planctopirus limnophila DSM 3776]